MPQTIIDFLQSYFTGFFGGFAVLLVTYLLIWKLFGKALANRKNQPNTRAGFEQIKQEVINSLLVTFGATIVSTLLFTWNDSGLVRFYTDINLYGGIWYVIFSFVFIIIFNDIWFYVFHRLMHHPKLYKYVHAVHHKSLDVNPFTANSFHIIESTILSSVIIPLAFMIPIYIPMLGVVQFVGLFNNIKSHLGYELYPKWFQKTPLKYLITSTHHNIHHTKYNGNYGLMFTFWDTMLGTDFKETDTVFAQIRDRKEVVVKDNTKYQTIKISKIVKETTDTCSVYFEPSNQDFFDYLPGQYINIRLKIAGKTYDRVFSLSSSPNVDKFLRITVKLNGVVTNHFYNDAKAGDEIEALLPMGDFNVLPDPKNSDNYVFIAGGSGITPLFSMLKSILYQEPKSTVTLLYANKNEESKIFSKELEELENKFEQFKVLDYFSGQKRIDQVELAKFTRDQDTKYYICGPVSLKSAVKQYLKYAKIDQSKINTEDFVDGYVSFWEILNKQFSPR